VVRAQDDDPSGDLRPAVYFPGEFSGVDITSVGSHEAPNFFLFETPQLVICLSVFRHVRPTGLCDLNPSLG